MVPLRGSISLEVELGLVYSLSAKLFGEWEVNLGFLLALLRPIMKRLRAHMSVAYDGSQLTGHILDLRTKVDMISNAMSDTQRRLEQLCTTVDAVTEQFDNTFVEMSKTVVQFTQVLRRTEQLQVGLDALRADHRLGLDGSRTDQLQRTEQLQNGFEALRADHQLSLDNQRVVGASLQQANKALMNLSTLALTRAEQLLQRAAVPIGRELLMRIPEGFLLVPSEDSALVATLWESGGRLEVGTLKLVNAFLDEGDRVLDVGANIGLVSLPAARRVGPTGQVIAIEPASRLCELLQRSMAMNFPADRFTIHRCAAGDETGTAVLNLGIPIGHSSLLALPGSVSSEQVAVRRLDDLVEKGLQIKLAKLDVEGFEPQVWRGMERIVAENPGLVVIVEFGPEHLRRAGLSIDAWLAMFLAPGFTAYEIDEAEGSLKPLRPRADLASVTSLNLLLTRQPPSAYPALVFTGYL